MLKYIKKLFGLNKQESQRVEFSYFIDEEGLLQSYISGHDGLEVDELYLELNMLIIALNSEEPFTSSTLASVQKIIGDQNGIELYKLGLDTLRRAIEGDDNSSSDFVFSEERS